MGISGLKFGVNVNTRAPIIVPGYGIDKVLALAEKVEALGYEGVWVGDNYFAKGRFESVTTLAAIAARTKRVTLGTSALIMPLRNTVWLAIAWASMDRISNGRSILNVCVGGGSAKLGGPLFDVEFQVAGVPYNKRGAIMEEQIEVIRRLWQGDKGAYKGEHHDLPELDVVPHPGKNPPIWISNNPQLVENLSGKVAERMMKRVAIVADGWMTALATGEEFGAMWQKIVGYAKEAGRDPATIAPAYQMTLTIDKSRDLAAKSAGEFLNAYYGTNYPDIRDSMWGRDPMGDADECYKGIKALIDAGCREFAFRFAGRNQYEQVEEFTEKVLPRLRALAK